MIQLSDALFERILTTLEACADRGNGTAEELLEELQALKAERDYGDLLEHDMTLHELRRERDRNG